MTTTTAIATTGVCRYCKRTPTAPNFMRGLGYPYTGQEANAHVETHREHLYRQARLELEAWVENEDRDQAAGRLAEADRRTCRVCPAWLVPGHAETPYHVNSAAMEARRAQFAAERAAAAAEPQPAPA